MHIMISYEYAAMLLMIRLIAAAVFLSFYIKDKTQRNLLLAWGWGIYAASAGARFFIPIAPLAATAAAGACGIGALAVLWVITAAYVDPRRLRFGPPIIIITIIAVPVSLLLRGLPYLEAVYLLLQLGLTGSIAAVVCMGLKQAVKPLGYVLRGLLAVYLAGGLLIVLMVFRLIPPNVAILINVGLNTLMMLFFFFAEHTLIYTEVQKSAGRMWHAEQIAGIGYWEYDPYTGENSWTEGLFRVFDLPGKTKAPRVETIYDRVHPDDLEQVRQHFRKTPRPGTKLTLEYRLCRSDGTYGFVYEEKSVDPETGYYYGLIYDVTRLKEYQRKLEEALKEKDVLLREIHHRVKNNLQIILSLFRLKTEGADKTADALDSMALKKAINDIDHRLNAMLRVHERLLAADDLACIDTQVYLSDVAHAVFDLHRHENNNIELEVDVAGNVIPVDIALPCCLIVAEAVSNACRHAFPDHREPQGEQPRINVIYRPGQEGTELIICDNGVGFRAVKTPADEAGIAGSKTDRKRMDSPPLGMAMIESFAAQLRGKVTQTDIPGGGACLHIIF